MDIVIERGIQALAGVEIKAGATVTATDFRALRELMAAVSQVGWFSTMVRRAPAPRTSGG